LKVEIVASNIEIIARLRDRVGIILREASEAWASRIEQILRMHTPLQDGRLRNELYIELRRDGIAVVGPEYLLYLILGTRPHEILPHRARALRFDIEGRVIFAKRVYHPGFPPQPFFREFLRKAFEILPEILAEVLRNA